MLKSLLFSLPRSSPLIDPVEFSDGLLAFRCKRRLPFQAQTVASPTPDGPVTTEVLVCSYDSTQGVYRARVANPGTLQKMRIDSRQPRRLAQALRVSSRQIPKYFALTEDISSSGLRLATEEPLAVGSTLEMSLDLDDPTVATLRLRGQVRWTATKGDGSHHSGVRFVDLDRNDGRVLERYIESRLATHRSVHGEE